MTGKNSKPAITSEQILALAPQLRELLNGVHQVELEHFSMEIGNLELFHPHVRFRDSEPRACRPVPSHPGKTRET